MKDVTNQILKQPLNLTKMSEKTTRKDIYIGKTKKILKLFSKEPIQTRVFLGKTQVRNLKLSKGNIVTLVRSYFELYLLDVGYTNEKDAFLIHLRGKVPKQEEERGTEKKMTFFF